MEKILTIALEAEQKAQDIIARAQEQKAVCDENIAKADTIREEYIAAAAARIDKFEEWERAEAERQCKQLDAELAAKTEKFEMLYESHSDEWVGKLYRSITEKL